MYNTVQKYFGENMKLENDLEVVRANIPKVQEQCCI